MKSINKIFDDKNRRAKKYSLQIITNSYLHCTGIKAKRRISIKKAQKRGRRHEVSTGGKDSDWGDGFRWVKTTFPPNSDFFSNFGHIIYKNIEKSENFDKYPGNFLL